MNIPMPIIGIPGWDWKGVVDKYAEDHMRVLRLSVSKDICYECERHYQLLQFFDEDRLYKGSEYEMYQQGLGKSSYEIKGRARKFKKLYRAIKKRGMDVSKPLPVITDNGCRINGSHRFAILIHLGVKEVVVNVVRLKDVFHGARLERIKAQVEECRRLKMSVEYQREHCCGCCAKV